ncbi:MAG: hypothetical protein RBT51_07375, partial [Ectothiorhodospiraceae bacterium]|nr:hypothetical protein [Ectothiorhodospiraceae bacterium]
MKCSVAGIACGLALSLTGGNAAGIDWELSGQIAGELRLFPSKPAFAEQEDHALTPSLIAEPRLVVRPDSDGIARMSVVPHARWDPHGQYSDVDFREANLLLVGRGWDLVLGIDRRFWGVTESLHLVDVINQTDMADGPDSETKLGQPMVNLNLIGRLGTLSLFALPGFVERNFADAGARLQGPYEIDREAEYASARGDDHVDYALRYAHTIGPVDVGLSHFRGTGREPHFRPRIDMPGFRVVLTPYYEQIEQTGLDLQLTRGAWLWKLEA